MANPPITIGPFDNVPAPGSPIRSDWPQEISTWVLALDTSAQVPAGFTPGPYVGGWGPAGSRVQLRAGHASFTTSAFGDAIISFQTPFPNGVIALYVGPVTAGSAVPGWFGWAQTFEPTVSGFRVYIASPQGWPFATGHPPSMANVWTVASVAASLDYIAVGI